MKLSGQEEKAQDMKSRVSPRKGKPKEPQGRRGIIVNNLAIFLRFFAMIMDTGRTMKMKKKSERLNSMFVKYYCFGL